MFKFFRQTRQKVLQEGRFSRYLFYALGEIILIVFGILIALQINNWNQENLAESRFNSLLVNLRSDLQKDQYHFQWVDSASRSHARIAISVRNLLKEENTVNDIDSLVQLFGNYDLDYVKDTYETLINTGLIYNSTDQNFNSLVSNYYRELEDTDKLIDRLTDIGVKLKYDRSLLNYRYLLTARTNGIPYTKEMILWTNSPDSETNKAVFDWIGTYLDIHEYTNNRIKKLIDLNSELVAEIDKKLGS